LGVVPAVDCGALVVGPREHVQQCRGERGRITRWDDTPMDAINDRIMAPNVIGGDYRSPDGEGFLD